MLFILILLLDFEKLLSLFNKGIIVGTNSGQYINKCSMMAHKDKSLTESGYKHKEKCSVNPEMQQIPITHPKTLKVRKMHATGTAAQKHSPSFYNTHFGSSSQTASILCVIDSSEILHHVLTWVLHIISAAQSFCQSPVLNAWRSLNSLLCSWNQSEAIKTWTRSTLILTFVKLKSRVDKLIGI